MLMSNLQKLVRKNVQLQNNTFSMFLNEIANVYKHGLMFELELMKMVKSIVEAMDYYKNDERTRILSE